MKRRTAVSTVIMGAAILCAAPFSLQWSQKTVKLSLDSAEARIGRPLTPFSVAGVHRRAYRRAVYGTAAAYGVGSHYGATRGYGHPASGYGTYASSYQGYGYGSYASTYPGYGTYASGYPGYGHRSLYASAGYPGYGYGGWAARRVAIHRARWH